MQAVPILTLCVCASIHKINLQSCNAGSIEIVKKKNQKKIKAVELFFFLAQSYRKKIHGDYLVAANSPGSVWMERRGEETGCSRCVPINPVWDSRFSAPRPLSPYRTSLWRGVGGCGGMHCFWMTLRTRRRDGAGRSRHCFRKLEMRSPIFRATSQPIIVLIR